MTYNVFGGTLSLTQSINQPADCVHWCSWKVKRGGFRSETTASLWDARKPGLSIRSVASCGH